MPSGRLQSFWKWNCSVRSLEVFLGVGMFALIVVFQQEIRRFLLMIGSTNFSARRKFIKQFRLSDKQTLTNIEAIIQQVKKWADPKLELLLYLNAIIV